MSRQISRLWAFLSRTVAGRLFFARGMGAVVQPDPHGVGRRIVLLVFAAVSLLYLYAACIELGLSADGAYFFMRALDDQRILVPEPSRLFASVIQMWPVTTAARLGVTSLPLLKALFHLALFLPFLVSMGICWYVARSLDDDALLLFPLASQLLVSLPASSILAGQNEVLAVVVWPVLLLSLKPRLTWVDGGLLLLLLVTMTRLYEASASSALLIFALTGLRALVVGNGQRQLFLLAALLALATPLWAVYSTFSDFTVRSQGDFVAALSTPILRYPQLHPMLSLSGAALLLVVAAAFVRERWRKWALLAAVAVAVLSIATAAAGLIAGAGTSFNMRTLTFTLLPVLMGLAVYWHWRGVPLPRSVWLVGGAAMVLLAIGYAVSWSAWADYRRAFRAELASHTGYVDIKSTTLAGHSQRWNWTPSVLSVLWSGECVRTIIWNSGNTEWPIRLHEQFPLQAYVHYDAALAGGDRAGHCAN